MAESKQKEKWSHTSNILAMIANTNRDPKKAKVYKPADFNPFIDKKKSAVVVTKENISILRNFFVGEKNNENRPNQQST